MKLSDAIRLGAMMRPQELQMVFKKRNGQYCSCAIGAAAEAAGEKPNDNNDGLARVMRLWPFVTTYALCPFRKKNEKIWSIIAMANNSEHWTRERIADWVSTIEPQEAEAVGEEQLEKQEAMR